MSEHAQTLCAAGRYLLQLFRSYLHSSQKIHGLVQTDAVSRIIDDLRITIICGRNQRDRRTLFEYFAEDVRDLERVLQLFNFSRGQAVPTNPDLSVLA